MKTVQLPTRRQEEKPHAPVTHKVKTPQQTTPSTNGAVQKKVQKVVGTVHGAREKSPAVAATVKVRERMRAGEITLLDSMMDRIEIFEGRGKKPKPALCLTKGELEALTVGMGILHGTVKVKN